MGLLTPLFLLGLAGLAVPVVIHLIQRERKNVVQFPSLMFLQRISYQSVRRRRIRNWPLLALRLLALALIVAAFARPFMRRPSLAAAAAGGGREVVILVDRSYSMGYADRWTRATAAARDAIGKLNPGDRASLVFFASGAEVALRSASDRGRLNAAMAGTKPGDGATRYGPALKLAGSIVSDSPLTRREVILISDFQRAGWQGTEAIRLPDGVVLTPAVIGDEQTANVSVTPVSLQRATFNHQDRVTVTAGAINHGSAPIANLALTLEVNGRAAQTEHVNLESNGSASVTFAAFTPDARDTRATVRIASDTLAADNAFHFVVSPRESLKIVVADRPGATRDAGLYLTRALALVEAPPFDVTRKSIDALSADDLQRAAVVVLNDVPVPQLTAERLGTFVARGGGLLLALGERAAWPAGVDVLPGVLGAPVDRSNGQPGRLGAIEYGHPIFESFRAARSGDFSGARFFSYRAVEPAEGAQTIARFDDGAPALMERRLGHGRVVVWASTLDLQWNDFPLKPVFLPFVHRLATTLASYSDQRAWLTVGDVLEPVRAAPVPGAARAPREKLPRVVLTPAGQRVALDGEGPDILELAEQGFYEIRASGRDGEAPVTVASNVDLKESALAPMDPQEVVAAAMGRAGGAAAVGSNTITSDQDHERAQRVWWYLLFVGIWLLGVENLISNRTVERVN